MLVSWRVGVSNFCRFLQGDLEQLRVDTFFDPKIGSYFVT